MKIIQIIDKEKYNSVVSSQKHSQFLQSFEWGEFHREMSGKIFRFGVVDNEKLVAAATVIKKQLPMGKNYFYCPRGPIINNQLPNGNQEIVLENLFNEIKKFAKNEDVMFLRFDPPSPYKLQAESYKLNKTLDVQPSKTLILNLEKPEEELLKDMHQKTRYNIRLAEKKGVKTTEAGIERFDEFWQLMGETSERDSFRLHGKDYYKEMIKVDGNFMKLFFAEYNNKLIAANIVSFFGDTVTYVHGASGGEHRNVMAPYFLQWSIIKSAKESGYKYYDFYGIDEKKWPGVTRFKNGFGGKEVSCPGTFDLIFDKGWYNVYRMVRKVRRTF